MTPEEIKEQTAEIKIPAFAAKEIATWIYRRGAKHIGDFTNISKFRSFCGDKSRFYSGHFLRLCKTLPHARAKAQLFQPVEVILEK